MQGINIHSCLSTVTLCVCCIIVFILSIVCDPGFYASAALESCVRCPNNSNSTRPGLLECPCDEGYYRTPQEVDLPCTSE